MEKFFNPSCLYSSGCLSVKGEAPSVSGFAEIPWEDGGEFDVRGEGNFDEVLKSAPRESLDKSHFKFKASLRLVDQFGAG